MNERHLHRCYMRFPRTAASAFRGPDYAQAFEHHLPGRSYTRWVVLAVIALCLLPLFWR